MAILGFAKTAYDWIIDLAYRIYSLITYFGKKQFEKKALNVFISSVDEKLDEFYSVECLDNKMGISLKSGMDDPQIIKGKLFVYVTPEEIRHQDLALETKEKVVALRRSQRTRTIRQHMPAKLRRAIDTVADHEILQDLEALSDSLYEGDEEERDLIKKVEDLHFSGDLRRFFKEVKNRYAGRRVSTRTIEDVWALFTEFHKKYLRSEGGIIKYVSSKQLEYLVAGLRAFFIPHSSEREFPSKIKEWLIFFYTKKQRYHCLCGMARITEIKRGKFDDLFNRHREVLRIHDHSSNDSKKIHSDWVKGIGGFKTKKKPSIGSHLDVYLIKTIHFSKIEETTSKRIIKELRIDLSPLRIITIEEARKIRQYLIPPLP